MRQRVAWDSEVSPWHLPRGMELVLADIALGSNTPGSASAVLPLGNLPTRVGMVGKLMRWKRDQAETG